MSTKIQEGIECIADEVKTGTNKDGDWLMIKTKGEHSDKDKTLWTLFVNPVVEIYEGGRFVIDKIIYAQIKNVKKAGVWHNNEIHGVSITVTQKKPPEKPDSFGGFDFSEPEEDELTLPY